jgi:hypothetical protein
MTSDYEKPWLPGRVVDEPSESAKSGRSLFDKSNVRLRILLRESGGIFFTIYKQQYLLGFTRLQIEEDITANPKHICVRNLLHCRLESKLPELGLGLQRRVVGETVGICHP